MRPRQSQWLIPPGICLLSSGWMVSAQQARTSPSGRHERLRGCNGRRQRSRTTLIRAERIRHRRHRGAARRHADTRQRRSRGRGRYCRLEQGDRHRDCEHRGGSLEPLTKDSSAQVTELLLVWARKRPPSLDFKYRSEFPNDRSAHLYPDWRAITVRSHERSLSNAKLIECECRLHASHLMAASR
jgi:hypothetical protein